jgi:hypothetical protein
MIAFIDDHKATIGIEPICRVSRRRRHRFKPGGERRLPRQHIMKRMRGGIAQTLRRRAFDKTRL